MNIDTLLYDAATATSRYSELKMLRKVLWALAKAAAPEPLKVPLVYLHSHGADDAIVITQDTRTLNYLITTKAR